MPGILSGQELNPESPHYGGFRWELEMEQVEDLNAVEFILHSLVPIMILHRDKLSDSTKVNIKKSIRLGLQNIAAMDVDLKYTNIVLKDITNTSLGGELLGDKAIAQRGYDKLKKWLAFTDKSGAAYEYNSLPYSAVAIEVLYRLQKYVKDEETRMLAKLALYRLGLSGALHLHTPTKRWAGPHGRAYHNAVIGDGDTYLLEQSEISSFRDWITDGKLPNWMFPVFEDIQFPDQVVETTGREDDIYTSCFLDENYSFGVGARNMFNQANRYIAWQTNVFSIHYTRPNNPQPGAIYTRYILDDKWLGYFSAGIGRGTSGLLPDEGHFQGLQDKERAIGLYIPYDMGANDFYSSAKSVVAIPRWAKSDEIWVDGKQVEAYPFMVPKDKTIVFKTGDILLGIRPFSLTNLGTAPQIVIDTKDDNTVVLEMYNYKGEAKTFWELAWPGAFYQGELRNGFYSEVSNTSKHTPKEFAKLIDQGSFTDKADPKFTYTGEGNRFWKVGYQRDGRTMSLKVDLLNWFNTPERIINNEFYQMPMLESNRAIQSNSGHLSLNDVELSCGKNSAWLYVSPDQKTVVAAYHGPEPAPFKLNLKNGEVFIKSLASGIVTWENGKVTVDGYKMEGKPKVRGGKLKKWIHG